MEYELGGISLEELKNNHKKQKKELTAVITGLKKQTTKKNKKSIQDQINELTKLLNQRHQKELIDWQKCNPDSINEASPPPKEDEILPQTESQDTPLSTPPIKRNRQKERLAKRDAKLKQIRDEAIEESKNSVDHRKIEMEKMQNKLHGNSLEVYEILPDGNCLFNSIRHQLQRIGIEKSVQDLRFEASDYILKNKETFEPFLLQKGDDVISLQDYCDKLGNTTMWGSDLEILAFSCIYKCRINVYIADGDTIVFNEEATSPQLNVGFYKYSYGLGEHYNSLVSIQ